MLEKELILTNINQLISILPPDRPIGITFKTKNKYYLYDTCTGKVLECGKVEYDVLNKILTGQYDEIEFLIGTHNMELINAIATLSQLNIYGLRL